MNTVGLLGLSIPEETQVSSPFLKQFDKNTLNTWLETIPNDNLSLALKTLYSGLLEMNKTRLSPRRRFEALETLLPKSTLLCLELNKDFLDDNDLSNNKKRKALLLIQLLHLELCNGYKLVVETHAKQWFKSNPILLKSLYQITLLNLETLQICYTLYADIPKGLWREIHVAYMISENLKLSDIEIIQHDLKPLRHRFIKDAYKHALLFSTTNPYRLGARDIYKLNFALESWAPLLELSPPTTESQNLFILDLQSDLPPRYKHMVGSTSPHRLTLDLSKIIKQIDGFLTPSIHTKAESQLPMSLLHFLHNRWHHFSERNALRIKKEGVLRVLLGLKEIYIAVSKTSHLVNAIPCDLNPDKNTETICLDKIPLPQQEDPKREVSPFLEGRFIDVSPLGFCFEWKSPFPERLRVGEIIGIEQMPELEGFLCLGFIRWLKQIDNNTIHCGVKLISPYAIPVLTLIPDQQPPLGVKSLLLPSEPRFHPHVTLIVPALPFRKGDSLSITHDDHMYTIGLDSVTDNVSTMNQFNIHFKEGAEIPFVHIQHPFQVDGLWNKLNNQRA